MEKGAGSLGAQLAEAELKLAELSQQFAQSGDADVFKEIEKTAKDILTLRQQTAREEEKIRQETSKTSEEYRKQAEATAKASVSLEDEIEMLQAKLTGNIELTEELQRQKDFREAFEKTGDAEKADEFAELRAQERFQKNQDRLGNAASPMPSGGSAPRTMRDFASEGDEDARAAQLRSESKQSRFQDRINRALNQNRPRSAAQIMEQAERAAQRDEDRFRGLSNIREDKMGNNMGEAYRNFRDTFGMDSSDLIRERLGEDFDPTKSMQENFKTMAEEYQKPEEQRKMEREQNEPPGGGGSEESTGGILSSIQSTLESFKASMEERLPQVVMGT
jgi:hypothetical protein